VRGPEGLTACRGPLPRLRAAALPLRGLTKVLKHFAVRREGREAGPGHGEPLAQQRHDAADLRAGGTDVARRDAGFHPDGNRQRRCGGTGQGGPAGRSKRWAQLASPKQEGRATSALGCRSRQGQWAPPGLVCPHSTLASMPLEKLRGAVVRPGGTSDVVWLALKGAFGAGLCGGWPSGRSRPVQLQRWMAEACAAPAALRSRL
jgi:hypothetical protein